MTTNPHIPVSIGEVYDKYSILEIKQTKISDPLKLKHINTELEVLHPYILNYNLDENIYLELKNINLKLWGIEDKLRIKESKQEFDNEFIQLARSVYFTNDERGDVKKKINTIFNSQIYEVKSYIDYRNKAEEEKQLIIKEYDDIKRLSGIDKNSECIHKLKELLNKLRKSTLNDELKHNMDSTICENIGYYYFTSKHFSEAISYYTYSLDYQSMSYSTLSNIGTCYTYLKQFDKAEDIFKTIIDKFPYESDIYNKIGFSHLIQKKIKSGVGYINEYHKKIADKNELHMIKRWDGSLPCKSIVIDTEGLGDMMQFGRYIIEFSKKYPETTVYFWVDNKIKDLFNFNNSNIKCISLVTEIYDYRIDTLSLMYFIGIETITPFRYQSYIVESTPNNEKWKEILKRDCTKKLKICICWKGALGIVEKHIPLSKFNSLTNLDIDLISLQCGSGSEEIDDCSFKMLKYDIDKDAAFIDSIAIIRNSDLVITVDTSILHLSAIMGVKTWLILGNVTDWRWFNNDKTTEWYNNVTIFKSKKVNEWDDVFHEIHNELQKIITTHNITECE